MCVDGNHQQIDIGDEATRVSFLPFMILSCTGLGEAAISGLSRSSTALSALHTRLTAFYGECTSFWYVNFASEMKAFGLVGGVRVHMVVSKAHKYGQYHRNQQTTTQHAPAAIDAATRAGADFVLWLFAPMIITNRSISATKPPASAFFHS